MARFTIYSPTGAALYTGTPTFTGQYMKPGFLEFRDVALPSLVDLVPGCYVGYEQNGVTVPQYSRTGFSYKIYTVPQLKKQARSLSYGGAFVYQSVQLYDASKMLEYCPFRDLVLGDNRIHFSTQSSISTFEGCDGLARRFEACLQDQYGADSWRVRIATSVENPDLYDLMIEPRDFTVSGLNILECLDKVYEIWPGVGWIYKVENGKDTIVIGGSGINPNVGTHVYGKGSGLTSLTRVAANADEIANRIFAYGSSRNMLPRWYNSQDIKDAESVDIQNLMLPVEPIVEMDWDGWGETDGERDAAKAYVEDSASIAKNGLRPATVYFDGKGEYPEIYPSLRETTIAMVRAALGSSSAKYYPRTDIYTNASARVDKILSAQSSFDSGLAGENGKSSVDSKYQDISEYESVTFSAGWIQMPVYTYEGTYTPSQSGEFALSLGLNVSGYVSLSGIKALNILGVVSNTDTETDLIFDAKSIPVVPGENSITIPNLTFEAKKVQLDSSVQYFVGFLFTAEVEASTQTDRTCTVDFSGGYSLSLSNYRSKTFNISLRQLGFDINEQSALGNGKTIAMRSGDCVGRSFAIKSVQYNAANDCWDLECWRTEDESLSQWFPNTDYPVEAEDEFVLLDIAMPGIYVFMAEQKLLTAARDLLADCAIERWQYAPEIDAKFMVGNGLVINAGESMTISDPDIIGENPESIIVDTVIINEGEAAIPTYKVSLRDRKKKTWTESLPPESSSGKSVGNFSESNIPSSGGDNSFFQLDESGNVTLKPQYKNLWVSGWLAAGGVGNGPGGGGGGGAFCLNDLLDVESPDPSVNDLLRFNGTAWVNVPQSQIAPSIGFSDLTSHPNNLSGYGINDAYTKSQVDTLFANMDLSAYVTGTELQSELASYATIAAMDTAIASVNVLESITTTQDGTVDFTWHNGNVVKVDFNHEHSNYVPITRTINGVDLSQNRTFYVGKSPIQSSAQTQDLLGINSIKATDAATSQLIWDNVYGAWRVRGNLYADGWISAGGIGINGNFNASSLDDLLDVSVPTPTVGDFLYYNGSDWVGTKIKTINQQSLIGSGNITIEGGGGGGGYVLPIASASLLGGIKVGSGLSIDANGVLSTTGGGGSTVSWGQASGGTIPLTVNGVSETLLLSSALDGYATQNWVQQQNYLPLTGGTMTGNIVMSGANIVPSSDSANNIGGSGSRFQNGHIRNIYTSYFAFMSGDGQTQRGNIGMGDGYASIILVGSPSNTSYNFYDDAGFFHGGNGDVPCGRSDHRWSELWAVDADLSGDLSLAQTSHIDIGPLRIEYDATNKALHITKADSNDSNTYGLYADGFSSAGGIGQTS